MQCHSEPEDQGLHVPYSSITFGAQEQHDEEATNERITLNHESMRCEKEVVGSVEKRNDSQVELAKESAHVIAYSTHMKLLVSIVLGLACLLLWINNGSVQNGWHFMKKSLHILESPAVNKASRISGLDASYDDTHVVELQMNEFSMEKSERELQNESEEDDAVTPSLKLTDLVAWQGFFNSLSGNAWYACNSTNVYNDPCNSECADKNIFCEIVKDELRITKLILKDMNLRGWLIESHFKALSELKYIDISGPKNSFNNIDCVRVPQCYAFQSYCSATNTKASFCPQLPLKQSDLVAWQALYSSLQGRNWKFCNDQGAYDNPCGGTCNFDPDRRVTCEAVDSTTELRITEIRLKSNNLKGWLTETVFNSLTAVNYLDLRGPENYFGNTKCISIPRCYSYLAACLFDDSGAKLCSQSPTNAPVTLQPTTPVPTFIPTNHTGNLTLSPTAYNFTLSPTDAPTQMNYTASPTVRNETFAPSVHNFTASPTYQNFTSVPTTFNFTSNPTSAPTAYNYTTAPTYNNETHAPTISNYTASPTYANITDSPTVYNFTNTPTLSPTVMNYTASPTYSNITWSPTTNNYTASPTYSNFTEAPTQANYTATPTHFNYTNIPTTSPSFNYTASPTYHNETLAPTVYNFTNTPTLSPTVMNYTASPTYNNATFYPTIAPTASNFTASPTYGNFTASPTAYNFTASPTFSPTTSNYTNTTHSPTASPIHGGEPTINPDDLLAWQSFFTGLQGTNWDACGSDKMYAYPCTYAPTECFDTEHRVVCSPIGGELRITIIILPNNNLRGWLPDTAINSMTSLRFLDISNSIASTGRANVFGNTKCLNIPGCSGNIDCNLQFTGVELCEGTFSPTKAPVKDVGGR